jgi:hypothetical protein
LPHSRQKVVSPASGTCELAKAAPLYGRDWNSSEADRQT